jgi:hypothetical protein
MGYNIGRRIQKMKLLALVVFCSVMALVTFWGAVGQEEGNAEEYVGIAPNCVSMPLGRILLAHKGSEYCAVKLTETWTGETKADIFYNYESYYLGDGSGNPSNAHVMKGQLARRSSIMFGKIILYHTGPENYEVKCGPMKLYFLWGSIYFYDVRRPGRKCFLIDGLAPTKWTDISQVNVFDPRLKWFRNGMQSSTKLALDQLWEDGQDKESK